MVIIWGAGRKGKEIAGKLRKEEIKYFVDSDPSKIGIYREGIEVKSIETLKFADRFDDIILTVVNDEILNYLRGLNIENIYTIEDYFNQPSLIEKMDDDLYTKYCYDYEIKEKLFFEDIEKNWFRKEAYNNINENLLKCMKKNDLEGVNEILDSVYAGGRVAFDTYYSVRPGIRLANRIISSLPKSATIVDFACGWGELIIKLSEQGYDAYGCDYSNAKVDYLKEKGVKASVYDVMKTGYLDAFFDVVICMENLEHVTDVIKTVDEIYRVLKIGGMVIISCPYLKNCDCSTHVRQFDEVKLASLFCEKFEMINMIKMPYLNWTADDNLFYVAKKIK